ncbi:dimethylsulfonioproprionate lyase family protein [Caballeronia sp. GAWG2-1]|uniref:dimethylsulfonioproprionate lyase family protein n=1 Tax=Caballeronia sp. GAWG2-1 TaxID=2921744 RepID=UPI0032EDB136
MKDHFAEAMYASTLNVATSLIGLAVLPLCERLSWWRRSGIAPCSRLFNAHANALVIGPGGLATLPQLRVGMTILAPHARYPSHRHPSRELYIVMSEGEWRCGDSAWWSPGMGGVSYTPSNAMHSMRALHGPLLAIWCALDS